MIASVPGPIRRWWLAFALAVLALDGIAAGVTGIGRPFDDFVSEVDGRVRHRAASGDLDIVEIDARSIAKIDRWPWPRSNYAQVVDRLKAAGAASVAFDVDFSSRSTPAEDATFARSLATGGAQVVLPTFGQGSGGGTAGWTDSLPIPALRAHAALAAVSILPDSDGYVRRIPVGTITGGVPRPSLSAMVAGVNGAAGSDFPIDLAIDRTSIPRHSFIDIRDGRFDPASIAGKDILIGATAIELGDRYAVPNNGVIPGVVIQAMAVETLRRGIPRESGWQLPLLAALAISALILRQRRRTVLAAAAVVAPALLFGATIAAHGLLNWRFEIAPAMLVLLCASGATAIAGALASERRQRLQDAETGLPNRAALLSLARTVRGVGIVATRISEFDKLIAGLGDAAAIDLVRRLRDRITLSTGNEAVYRVEDRVLAWQVFDAEDLEERLAILRSVTLAPFEVGGRRVDVALAIGVALEIDGQVTDRTLARAMLAADTARTNGENWHFHDDQENEAVDRDLSLLGELDEAIAGGDIGVVYQPKLCLRTDRVVSVEALVRWHHRTRGQLGPDLFIPLAERNDRIAGLTLHVVKLAIADLLSWRSRGHEITGAVNISVKLLTSAPFLSELRHLIEQSELPPHLLTLEITESAAMTDTAEAVEALRSFRKLGVGISIDDYGTGQSTLSYLKQLPLNELKIDRSFVQFAHINHGDGVLVRSTIDLAHELGLKVVAEGVEDAECLAFLRSIGCDMVQGYHVSRPVDATRILAKLGGQIDLAA